MTAVGALTPKQDAARILGLEGARAPESRVAAPDADEEGSVGGQGQPCEDKENGHDCIWSEGINMCAFMFGYLVKAKFDIYKSALALRTVSTISLADWKAMRAQFSEPHIAAATKKEDYIGEILTLWTQRGCCESSVLQHTLLALQHCAQGTQMDSIRS